MIHLVTTANRGTYEDQLKAYHVLRKQIFVDALGWRALKVVNGGEYDDYDDARATYLLGLDDDDRVRVGLRMRPADDRSIIDDLFPHLVDTSRPPARRADLWEGSRILSASGGDGAITRRLAGELRIAAVELGVLRGFSSFSGMCDVVHLPRWRANGWRGVILGAPAAYDEGEAFAFEAEVSRDAVLQVRARYGVTEQVIVELPHLVACTAPLNEIASFGLALARGQGRCNWVAAHQLETASEAELA